MMMITFFVRGTTIVKCGYGGTPNDVGALLRFYGPLLVRAHFPNRNTYHLGSSASMRHIISSIELSFAIRYLVYNVNNGRTKITCNFSIIKLDF